MKINSKAYFYSDSSLQNLPEFFSKIEDDIFLITPPHYYPEVLKKNRLFAKHVFNKVQSCVWFKFFDSTVINDVMLLTILVKKDRNMLKCIFESDLIDKGLARYMLLNYSVIDKK